MAVYVDDARRPASVRNGSRSHTSAWCHLTADTQEELHEFAARLGLRRSYFQPGKPVAGKPGPFWHYDVTADLSHGQPGHMCVMPGPEGDVLGGYEAEAG